MTGERLASRRAVLGLLAGLMALLSVPAVGPLLGHEPNGCYPFMLPDSWDWLNNALYWSGFPMEPSLRPPGLPLLLAALDRLGALGAFPILSYLSLSGTALALFLFLSRRHSLPVSFLTAWLFFGNAQLQDHSRYLMAELPATLFLLLAASAFERSASEPGAWIRFGLALSVSGLFHHAAIPAGAGFGAAVLLTRRDALREPRLWLGAGLAVLPLAGWLAHRSLYYRAHPGLPQHVQEALVRPWMGGVRYYVFSLAALVGLAALPLLAAGFAGLVKRRVGREDPFFVAYAAPLSSLGLFFVFLYGYVEKRLLIYLFPFALCLAAEGLSALEGWVGVAPVRRACAAGYVVVVLAWLQIRYPTSDATLLALSPRRFADLPVRLRRASVTTLYPTWAQGLLGGPLDPTIRDPMPCQPSPRRLALQRLAPALDRLLGAGERVGLQNPGLPPVRYWVEVNRVSNTLRRPVGRPDQARVQLFEGPFPEGFSLLLSDQPWSVVTASSR